MSRNQNNKNPPLHAPSLQMALLNLRWQQLRQLELTQTSSGPLTTRTGLTASIPTIGQNSY